MEIEVHVPEHWAECPPWWKNFIDSINPSVINPKYTLEDAFAEWDVRFVDNADENGEGDGYCYFKDEKTLTWFMLRWS